MPRNKTESNVPALDPRLTPRQLWALANEPGWWPYIDLIAGHPHAWPELIEWAADVREYGGDVAGRAPMPPAPQAPPTLAERLSAWLAPRRLPSPPFDPNDDGTMPAAEPADAAERIVRTESPFDRLDEFSEPEAHVADDSPAGESAEPDVRPMTEDTVHRPLLSLKHIAAALIIIVAAVMAAAGVLLWQAHETHRQSEALMAAISKCDDSYDAATAARRSYLALLADDDTVSMSKLDRGKVADAGTIDSLNSMLGKPNTDTGSPTRCTSGTTTDKAERATRANRQLASAIKSRRSRLRAAVAAVEKSKLSKTVSDANKLYESSAGKVDDESARTALKKAIETGNEQRIAEAAAALNASMQSKSEKDAQSRAEAEAAAQAQAQAQQSQSSPQPSYTPRRTYPHSSSGGTSTDGTGNGQQSVNPGWDVPAQSDPDPFAGTDPSL